MNLEKNTRRNPFVALCEYASRNNWCWKIICTTCGHSAFRVAFSKIVRNEHPDDDIFWPNGKENYSVFKERDSYNDFNSGIIDVDIQLKLARIVADAKISDIQKIAKFPDWLGYIGLVMHYCYNDKASKILSDSLILQFKELFQANKYMMEYLNSKQTLSVRDLEILENSII
ncbi:MAG: hypothetical protein WCS56_05550 [Bacilli bacterium]